MVRDLVFDSKKGHDIKISWCFFADLVNDGIYLLKLWAVTRCSFVVNYNNTLWARCFEGEGNVRNPHLGIE